MFGDGATNIGAFHESLNFAAVFDLPVVWFCVNNKWGMGTSVERASAVPDMYRKACAYDMEAIQVDGMNVLEVLHKTGEIVEKTRKDSKPRFIEAVTYRFKGHSVVDPDKYRDEKEKQEHLKSDPLTLFDSDLVATRIAEEVIVGWAMGSAMLGLRPVVEMMTVNFSLVAFDQIVQSAAKIRYMFGGQATVPLVIRMPGGAGPQLSAQHSHSFEALYGMIPALLVVAPTTPQDAQELLKSASRTPNPVLFLESMSLYNMKGEVPDDGDLTPTGKAALRRQGQDLTIVGVSRQSVLAQLAAQKLEEEDVDAEVIDLRTIRPIDWQPIVDSVKKTNRLLVVEEGWPTYGVSAEIAAGIQLRAFDYLDGPI